MSLPISGFTAVPNPQMLAFMATQSFLMMQMAGAGWQYGKRKVSAMKNEEFNALTVNLLLQKEVADVREAIPTIIQSINDMTPMVGAIVEQYGDFVKEIINSLPQAVENVYRPEHKPSIETFNPLSILNPLVPAFAEHQTTSTPTGVSASASSHNMGIMLSRNIEKMTDLRSLRNIALETYGLNPSDYQRVADALMARMEKLNPQITSTGIATGGVIGTVRNRWKGTSTQSLSIERNRLITEIRDGKANLHSVLNPQRGKRVVVSGKSVAQMKVAIAKDQQKLADILLVLRDRK